MTSGVDAPVAVGRCPVCGEGVGGGEAAVRCDRCATPHHHACWRWGGGCAVYGCGTRAYVAVPADPAGEAVFLTCEGRSAAPFLGSAAVFFIALMVASGLVFGASALPELMLVVWAFVVAGALLARRAFLSAKPEVVADGAGGLALRHRLGRWTLRRTSLPGAGAVTAVRLRHESVNPGALRTHLELQTRGGAVVHLDERIGSVYAGGAGLGGVAERLSEHLGVPVAVLRDGEQLEEAPSRTPSRVMDEPDDRPFDVLLPQSQTLGLFSAGAALFCFVGLLTSLAALVTGAGPGALTAVPLVALLGVAGFRMGRGDARALRLVRRFTPATGATSLGWHLAGRRILPVRGDGLTADRIAAVHLTRLGEGPSALWLLQVRTPEGGWHHLGDWTPLRRETEDALEVARRVARFAGRTVRLSDDPAAVFGDRVPWSRPDPRAPWADEDERTTPQDCGEGEGGDEKKGDAIGGECGSCGRAVGVASLVRCHGCGLPFHGACFETARGCPACGSIVSRWTVPEARRRRDRIQTVLRPLRRLMTPLVIVNALAVAWFVWQACHLTAWYVIPATVLPPLALIPLMVLRRVVVDPVAKTAESEFLVLDRRLGGARPCPLLTEGAVEIEVRDEGKLGVNLRARDAAGRSRDCGSYLQLPGRAVEWLAERLALVAGTVVRVEGRPAASPALPPPSPELDALDEAEDPES